MVWLLFDCAVYEKFDPQDGSVGKFCGTCERQSQNKVLGSLRDIAEVGVARQPFSLSPVLTQDMAVCPSMFPPPLLCAGLTDSGPTEAHCP